MNTAPELKASARLTISGLCEEIKTLTSIDDNRGWEYAAEKMLELKSTILRVLREQDASRVCPAIPAVISREEIDEAARLAS